VRESNREFGSHFTPNRGVCDSTINYPFDLKRSRSGISEDPFPFKFRRSPTSDFRSNGFFFVYDRRRSDASHERDPVTFGSGSVTSGYYNTHSNRIFNVVWDERFRKNIPNRRRQNALCHGRVFESLMFRKRDEFGFCLRQPIVQHASCSRLTKIIHVHSTRVHVVAAPSTRVMFAVKQWTIRIIKLLLFYFENVFFLFYSIRSWEFVGFRLTYHCVDIYFDKTERFAVKSI